MWLINVVVIITFVFNILQIVSKAVKEEKTVLYVVIGLAIFFESIFILNIITDKELSGLMQLLVLIFAYLIPMCLVYMKSLGKKLKVKIVLSVARALYNFKKYELADMMLEKAIAHDKKNAELYHLKGKTLERLNNLVEAVEMLYNSIELGINEKEVYYDIAEILDRLNKKDTAIVMLAEALKIDENYIKAKELLAIIYSEIGAVKDAINIYENMAANGEATADTFFNLAVMYSAVNEITKSIAAYEKSVELDNKLYEAYYSVGRLYYSLGEYESAKVSFEKALSDNNLKAKAAYSLALTNVNLGNHEQAVNNLKMAIELNNDYWEYAKTEPLLESVIYEIYAMSENNEMEQVQEEIEDIYESAKVD